LHEYVIMPNHIHGIIEITVGANCFSPIDGINTDHVLNAKNDLPIDPMNVEMDNIPQNDGMNADPIMRAKNISPLRWQRGTSQTLGSVIRGFKIGVTKWFRNETDVYDVWQRNYYEHIIRNQQSYDTITNYILTNVEKWPNDKFFIQ
jgi:putative transposase